MVVAAMGTDLEVGGLGGGGETSSEATAEINASWSTVREKQRCWSGALSFSSCEHWGEFPHETGLIRRFAGNVGNPLQTNGSLGAP